MRVGADDVQLFKSALRKYFIRAEVFGAIGSADPARVRFGCDQCAFNEALAKCQEGGFHLCYAVRSARETPARTCAAFWC